MNINRKQIRNIGIVAALALSALVVNALGSMGEKVVLIERTVSIAEAPADTSVVMVGREMTAGQQMVFDFMRGQNVRSN